MSLKVGDRVKFLNSTGGGIVTRVLDSRMVHVTDEHGFELPTLISELVRIDPQDPGSRFFSGTWEPADTPLPAEENPVDPDTGDPKQHELPDSLIRNRKSEDIYLAFVPHDQKWLITGPVDVYLLNNTSCDVIYNLFHRNGSGRFEGVDYGSVFSGTKLLLNTVNREELTHWTNGYLQFLFHKEQTNRVLPPFNSEISIDGKKFYHEGSYKESALIQAKGLVIRILSVTEYLNQQDQSKHRTNTPADPATQPPAQGIFKHQVAFREAEIDLHIHELVEDPSNLDKSEILEFQKSYMIRSLEEAITNHFLKLTIIHGVGNGILRHAILEIIKNYEGIACFDAPMVTYGVGALEIRLPHNH